MVYVRPLHTELMSTTALTPTHHKGGVGAIVGIVASIAIPFAAPAIASSLVTSGIISASFSTVASAAIGGVLGAGLAAATGGNPLLGGLGGALAGGIAGFNTPVSGAQSAISGGYAPLGSGIHGVAAPVYPGAVGLTSTPAFDPAASFFDSGVGEFGGVSTADIGGSFVNPTVVGQTAGDTLSGTFDPSTGTGAQYDAFGNVNPAYSGSSTPIVPGEFDGTGYSSGALRPSTTTPALSPQAATAPVATPAGASFTDKLTGFVTPERLQQGLSRLATNAFSEAFADKVPTSPEEDARMAFLNQQRAEQARLSGEKEKIANTFINQAGTISPLQYGQQALSLEQDRLLRAQQAGLRRIDPRDTGAVASQKRKDALAKSRLGAFQRGEKQGRELQAGYLSKAAATLPSGNALASGAASDLAAANERFLRLQQEQKNASDIFSTFLPEFGTKTKEEREKLAAAQAGV